MPDTIVQPSFSNSHGGTFILIEPSETPMASIDEPFFIGARPVTQIEWSAVMGENPSKFQEGWAAGLRPVERVSWLDCQDFIERLNEMESGERLGLIGRWRLPSEIEWEYACRAGSAMRWHHSDRDRDLDEVGWHAGNSGASTREVGLKKPNKWGLYDCHGNVSEWTSTIEGRTRITKGGSWLMESESTTCSAHLRASIDKRSDGIGLRLVWAEIRN